LILLNRILIKGTGQCSSKIKAAGKATAANNHIQTNEREGFFLIFIDIYPHIHPCWQNWSIHKGIFTPISNSNGGDNQFDIEILPPLHTYRQR